MEDHNTPKVSIVVAAYNEDRFLRDNIASILGQTYRNLEVIYVDDGSTDRTLDILKEYAATDARMSVLTQPNTGAGAARNKGMDAASGKYLCVLDADDTFEPEMVAEAVAKAEAEKADLVFWGVTACNVMSGETYEIKSAVRSFLLPPKTCFNATDIPEHIFQITGGWGWNKLFRLDFLRAEGHRFQNIPIIDDAFFSITVLATAQRICAINKRFANYRMNNTASQFADGARVARQFYLAIRKMRDWLQERTLLATYQYSLDMWAMEHFSIALNKCPDWMVFTKTYGEIRSHLKEFGMDKRILNHFHKGYEMQAFYTRLLLESPEQFLHEEYLNCTVGRTFLFPMQLFQKKDRVLIYGAGEVGKYYYTQAMETGCCQIAGWVDKKYENMQKKGYPVISIGEAMTQKFDYLLIAVESMMLAKSIRQELVRGGVSKEKIVWICPETRNTTY